MTTAEQLAHIAPTGRTRAAFLDPLNGAMAEFGIDTPRRQAAFLAECAHESLEFTALEENLNYSADGLRQTFGHYFAPEEFERFAHRPEAIANRVYANRDGNGDEASGDGWRYRGMGLIQVTFKYNHFACADGLGISRDEIGAYMRTPEGAARSAGWFWADSGLNRLADAERFDQISRIVNGAFRHFRPGDRDRYAYYEAAAAQLGLTAAKDVG